LITKIFAVFLFMFGCAAFSSSIFLNQTYVFGAVGTKILESSTRQVSANGIEIGPYRVLTRDSDVHVILLSDSPRIIYNIDNIPIIGILKQQDQSNMAAETFAMARDNELVYIQYAQLRKFPSAGAVLLSIDIDAHGTPLPIAKVPTILRYLGIVLMIIAALLVLSSKFKRRRSTI